jgi:methylated-DNA-[protein]-cysteine S-methyltransferase
MQLTKFQKKVYSEVAKIPRGKTSTYKAIAKKLKTSPRAVGQALKRSPFPIKIPCHRVIKSDGTLGGYKGKLNSETKRKLLEKEGLRIPKIFKK